MSLDKMIFALFDFIQVLIDCPKLRPLIIKSLQDLTYYIMIYSQITVSMVSVYHIVLCTIYNIIYMRIMYH